MVYKTIKIYFERAFPGSILYPMGEYRFFFEHDSPGFPFDFTMTLLEFPEIFHPGNPRFFLKFRDTPLNFPLISST